MSAGTIRRRDGIELVKILVTAEVHFSAAGRRAHVTDVRLGGVDGVSIADAISAENWREITDQCDDAVIDMGCD